MKFVIRKIMVLMLVTVLALSAMPVFAQGGLSDEEMELLTLFIEKIQEVGEYESYTASGVESTSQKIVIYSEGAVVQEQTSVTINEQTKTFVRGENPSGYAAAVITIEQDANRYVIEGELRYVDGGFYGRASYVEGSAEYIFEEGWVEFPDATSAGDLNVLEPDDLLETLENSEETPLADIELMQQILGSVTSEAGELEGQPVELLTLIIPTAGLFEILKASESGIVDPTNPLSEVIQNGMTEESQAAIILYLDADGNPLYLESYFVMIVPGIDLQSINPSAEAGVTLDLSLEIAEESTLSEVNAAAPITAPE